MARSRIEQLASQLEQAAEPAGAEPIRAEATEGLVVVAGAGGVAAMRVRGVREERLLVQARLRSDPAPVCALHPRDPWGRLPDTGGRVPLSPARVMAMPLVCEAAHPR
jgi:hypothetical protein